MSEKSVFSIFHYFICQYNSHEQPENEIILKQGFFTTRAGTVILYCFSLLAVVEIVIHFIVAHKTFVLSFTSFFIIIGLLFKRTNDKALYDKINQLEPRIPID